MGGGGTLINAGSDGDVGTTNRDGQLISAGGLSGWANLKAGNATYPNYHTLYPDNYNYQTLRYVGPFGTGGAGSRGEYDPTNNPSGYGENGWARIYFIF